MKILPPAFREGYASVGGTSVADQGGHSHKTNMFLFYMWRHVKGNGKSGAHNTVVLDSLMSRQRTLHIIACPHTDEF